MEVQFTAMEATKRQNDISGSLIYVQGSKVEFPPETNLYPGR